MAITSSLLDRVYRDNRERLGGSRDDYFALLYLTRVLNVTFEDASAQTAFDYPDLGISAYHLDTTRRILYLVIATAGRTYRPIVPRLESLTQLGLQTLFGTSEKTPSEAGAVERLAELLSNKHVDGRFLRTLRSNLFENAQLVDRVLVRLVITGDTEQASASEALGQLRDDLEARSHLLDEYFGKRVRLASEIHSVRDKTASDTRLSKGRTTYPIRLEGMATRPGPDRESMIVGFARLNDLRRIYEELGHSFLDKNIRAGLKETSEPNRAITKAFQDILLKKASDPRVFAFNHNGVTLYASRATYEGNKVLVTEPRLLNGAQSVATLGRFLARLKSPPEDLMERVDSLEVLCKIITDAGPDFIGQVTISNNRQNPVHPWNLRANDGIQLRLQDYFIENLGIYYERQENALESLSEEDLDVLGVYEDRRGIELLQLAKTYLASDGEVDKMSAMRGVFEDDSVYKNVFAEARLGANARHAVVCYKIHYRIRRLLQEILSRGSEKYAFIYRARNLVWALLCQACLNDDRLERMAAEHGEDLVASDGYMEWLNGAFGNRNLHLWHSANSR